MNDGHVEKLLARIAELEAENSRLKATLETRKLVERAKGVLMQRRRWTEARAYRSLQRTAMNRRVPLAALCQRILNGEEVFLDGDCPGQP